MNGFRKKQLFGILLISIFLLKASSIVAQPSWKQNSTLSTESVSKISINVAYATYLDADGDGLDDDVFANVELFLSGANRYNFDYWLTLTLPSGYEFQFGWVISTNLSYLNVTHDMINTALEPGWYHLHVEVVMKTGGVDYVDSEHVFDPPGHEQTGKDGSYATFSSS